MDFKRDTFERKFVERWNNHIIDDLLKLYSDSIVYKHQGEEPRVIKGRIQFKVYLKGLWTSIPDFEFKLLNTVWNENMGFGEWIGKGTFHGQRYSFGNVPENKKVQYEGVDIIILDSDGLIKEERAYYNMLDVIKQLQ